MIGFPGPVWLASVPVPTRNVKSTASLVGAADACTKSSSDPWTNGCEMQLPNCVGLICDAVMMLRFGRQSRAVTPKK